MRRSSPNKTPQDISRSDIEHGNKNTRRINPIRNLDPPPSDDPPPSTSYSYNNVSTRRNNTRRTSTSTSNNSKNLLKLVLTTIPTILRDTLCGVTLGTLFLLTLLLLDYHHILSFGSTRAFQSTAVTLLNDPDVLLAIEEGMGVKLLSIDQFTGIKAEISSNLELMSSSSEEGEETLFNKYSKDLHLKMKELHQLHQERDALRKEVAKKYDFDKWCGECKEGWGNCDARVKFLKDRYGNGEMGSMISIMKEGQCLKK